MVNKNYLGFGFLTLMPTSHGNLPSVPTDQIVFFEDDGASGSPTHL